MWQIVPSAYALKIEPCSHLLPFFEKYEPFGYSDLMELIVFFTASAPTAEAFTVIPLIGTIDTNIIIVRIKDNNLELIFLHLFFIMSDPPLYKFSFPHSEGISAARLGLIPYPAEQENYNQPLAKGISDRNLTGVCCDISV